MLYFLLFGRAGAPPKQQKEKHAPAQTGKKIYTPPTLPIVYFLLFGRVGVLVFLLFGRGAWFLFLCLGGGRVFFLLFGQGRVYYFVVWAGPNLFLLFGRGGGGPVFLLLFGRGGVFFFLLFGRGTGVHSLKGPNNKKDQTAKAKNTGSVQGVDLRKQDMLDRSNEIP